MIYFVNVVGALLCTTSGILTCHTMVDPSTDMMIVLCTSIFGGCLALLRV